MSVLYGRKTEIVIGSKSFNGDLLTLKFEVPFDDTEEPNVASVDMYNLSENSINDIRSNTSMYINAGYNDSMGTILIGTLKNLRTERKGVDKVTSFDVVDSGDAWLKTSINKTYTAGVAAKTILNDLLPYTGLKIAALNLPTNKVYPGGKTFNKTLGNAVLEVVKDCGARMIVNKNAISIRPQTEGNNIRFVLSSSSGLIGTPTRIEKEVVIGKDANGQDIKKTVSGWKVTSLLNHKISTYSIIEVSSAAVKGIFKVEKGRHTCDDTRFYTEMEVFPL